MADKVRAAEPGVPQDDWTVPDTGTHHLVDEHTPVRSAVPLTAGDIAKLEVEAVVRQRERVKETAQNVAAVRTTTEQTNVGVETLRTETKGHIDRIEGQVAKVDGKVDKVDAKVEKALDKVDTLGEHVMSLVGSQGLLTGQVGELVKAIDSTRTRNDTTFVSDTQIHTVGKVIDLKDDADAKKQARGLKYTVLKKAAIVVVPVLATAAIALVTHLIEHC